MRLQEIPSKIIDIETLGTKEPIVLVLSDGKARFAPLPSHGETKIVTHDDKVTRVNFNEGELFK
ncbi:XtrA/YqaO family protein [Bacillus safensis]|uniref:XtrA/YqaO family protein n=1 Tax=Bacillus safensis TaxID=561879 RepID=UPI00227DB6E8|nr:XtrA/YqaO family protein [Bacillus safensis]MCY7566178.1 XtrA/YqaO family protein [Bacillus safensis]MCY7625124.1 XtrA/YqaO family protein [Bacillus safensis]MCY7634793.1 XtrA/YqaO family protein [Bacillus safensis]MCY7648659.1 XtrA/YqaO family protein [Bacillus safensis]MCY7652233.1 XtrA/YqaO family protein [Bacillus safensis]